MISKSYVVGPAVNQTRVRLRAKGILAPGAKPRLQQPGVVSDGRGQRRPDVGQPPQTTLLEDHQKGTVQKRVVIDHNVAAAPNRQLPTCHHRELFTAEQDRQRSICHLGMLARMSGPPR